MLSLNPSVDERRAVSCLSLRDPDGQLVSVDGHLIRFMTSLAGDTLREVLSLPQMQELLNQGNVVPTVFLSRESSSQWLKKASVPLRGERKLVYAVEHPRIFFPSYPYEWPPALLREAGLLTLKLTETLLESGFGLKDATPYNILFEGVRPVFVDVLSFETRRPEDPLWRAYAQFVRTFIYPLLATKLGFPAHHSLLVKREGLDAADLLSAVRGMRRLQPGFLLEVALPAWLSQKKVTRSSRLYEPKRAASPELAHFILRRMTKSLRKRLLRASQGNPLRTEWVQYTQSKLPYSPAELDEKKRVVSDWLDQTEGQTLLDVGCNTGEFSILAARKKPRVVAIDSNGACVEVLAKRAMAESLNILPLLIDVTRPSPAMGWRNSETLSFLERANGKFDVVMALAVLHHLLVGEGLPLTEVLELMGDMTRRWLLIEFVGPADASFAWLAKGRDYSFLNEPYFENCAMGFFKVVRRHRISDSCRTLYLLEKK